MFNYVTEHENIWENGGVAPDIFISVLDYGGWAASRSAALPRVKLPLRTLNKEVG